MLVIPVGGKFSPLNKNTLVSNRTLICILDACRCLHNVSRSVLALDTTVSWRHIMGIDEKLFTLARIDFIPTYISTRAGA